MTNTQRSIPPEDPANAEYSRPCPDCKAPAGEPCWRLNGSGRLNDSHRARRTQ